MSHFENFFLQVDRQLSRESPRTATILELFRSTLSDIHFILHGSCEKSELRLASRILDGVLVKSLDFQSVQVNLRMLYL